MFLELLLKRKFLVGCPGKNDFVDNSAQIHVKFQR